MPSRLLSEGELAYFPAEQCRKIIHHAPIRQHLVEIKMITPQGRIIEIQDYASLKKKSGPTPLTLTGSFDATRSSSRKKSTTRALSASTARVGKPKEKNPREILLQYATSEESASSSENEKKWSKTPRRQHSALPPRRNNILLQRVITPKILKRSDYTWITFQYHKPTVSVEYDRLWFEPRGDEIMITQQHCGGENLIVHKDTVQYGGYFSIASRRHPTYPLALVFHINGTVTNRLSVCCEWRCQNKCRIGGPNGLFSIEKVENSTPCRRCRAEKYRLMFLEQMEARKNAKQHGKQNERQSPTDKNPLVSAIPGDAMTAGSAPPVLVDSRSSSAGLTMDPNRSGNSAAPDGKMTRKHDDDDDHDSFHGKTSPNLHSEEVKLSRPERPSLSAGRQHSKRSDSLSSDNHEYSSKKASPTGKTTPKYDDDFDDDSASSITPSNTKADKTQITQPTVTAETAPASIPRTKPRSSFSSVGSDNDFAASTKRASISGRTTPKNDADKPPNQAQKDSQHEESTLASLVTNLQLNTSRGSARNSESQMKGLEDSSIADTSSTIIGSPEKQTTIHQSSVSGGDVRQRLNSTDHLETEESPINRMEQELFHFSSSQNDDSASTVNTVPKKSTSPTVDNQSNANQQKKLLITESPTDDFFETYASEKPERTNSPILRRTPTPPKVNESSNTGEKRRDSKESTRSIGLVSSTDTSSTTEDDSRIILPRPKSSKPKRQMKTKQQNNETSSLNSSSDTSSDESIKKNKVASVHSSSSDSDSSNSSITGIKRGNQKEAVKSAGENTSESSDSDDIVSGQVQNKQKNSPPRISSDNESDTDTPRNTGFSSTINERNSTDN